jgi:ABC-2 type transport system permease protein
MKWNRITNLIRKDLMEVTRNKAVWMPMLIVPLVFVVLLPVGFALMAKYAPQSNQGSLTELTSIMVSVPPAMQAVLNGRDDNQVMTIFMLGMFMAPMFLVMPMMFSSIISAEAFAGEKERKTLEGLLYTPATDLELFLGKTLAAVIPAVVVSWGSFLIYILVVNIATNSMMGGIWFPLEGWYPLIFWVTPAVAVMGTMVTVLVSSRVHTFMEAYQSGSALVILVLGLVAGQMTGLLYLSFWMAMLVGLVIVLADVVLLRVCVKAFRRNRLIASV